MPAARGDACLLGVPLTREPEGFGVQLFKSALARCSPDREGLCFRYRRGACSHAARSGAARESRTFVALCDRIMVKLGPDRDPMAKVSHA